MSQTNFDEKAGVVYCNTEFGRWWQTVSEVGIEIPLPPGTKAKQLNVIITNSTLKVSLGDKTFISGKLASVIRASDSVWTIEDGNKLNILLIKSEYIGLEKIWNSLMEDGSFTPDPLTMLEMRKKLDLEKFQMENPGMDFSNAVLQKNYDEFYKNAAENKSC